MLGGCWHAQERLARFMGTEESIIYSYDLATVPSVLPAFANAKDIIVCDEVARAVCPYHILYPRHCVGRPVLPLLLVAVRSLAMDLLL